MSGSQSPLEAGPRRPIRPSLAFPRLRSDLRAGFIAQADPVPHPCAGRGARGRRRFGVARGSGRLAEREARADAPHVVSVCAWVFDATDATEGVLGVRGLTDPVASQVLEPADEAFGAALGAWSPERQYSGLLLGEGSGLTSHSGSAGGLSGASLSSAKPPQGAGRRQRRPLPRSDQGLPPRRLSLGDAGPVALGDPAARRRRRLARGMRGLRRRGVQRSRGSGNRRAAQVSSPSPSHPGRF